MKRISALLLSAVLLFAVCSATSCGNASVSGKYTVEMALRGYDGVVTIELDADEAPLTVENFINLVKEGHYDGMAIVRAQVGFVIQSNSGTGVKPLKGEFRSNNVDNNLKHKRGTISMARSNDKNSATDAFFICLDDSTASSLDGDYAGFGNVVSGMEIIDALVKDIKLSMYYPDSYYGGYMGFLQEQYYPIIEYIRVK
ncbi:MAG: peptidylprolyl isomerase [Clostridia bacterium]|nr:peptidylprolyl isomerase [Clostridia bacterium]